MWIMIIDIGNMGKGAYRQEGSGEEFVSYVLVTC